MGLSVFEYKGKEYKVWVDGVDPSRFTGDPLPEDPHKEQMEYLGWVPFGVTLCFSVMLVMGNGKEAMTGAMRVCNFLWAARSRLIDVGGDSVTK